MNAMAMPAGMFGLLPQQQAAPEPFQWGAGGRRMTPEAIAREREIANAMMGVDYSPIASPWQGLARVSENVLGTLRNRSADKAEQANMDYSQQILQELSNPGGSPSASGAPGVPSPAPGANIDQITAILADPYVAPQVRAIAQRQLDMADFERKQQLQSQYAEPTPEERLAKVAFPDDPARQSQFLQSVAANKEDPYVNVIGNPDFGTYAGRQSGLNAIIGGGQQAGQAPAAGTVVADPRVQAGMPSQSPGVIDAAGYRALAESLGGEAEAQAFIQRNGLTMGGR